MTNQQQLGELYDLFGQGLVVELVMVGNGILCQFVI